MITYRLIKRFIDIACSLLALIILSPLIILVAIIIFMFDKGPIFFKQKRIGFEGVEFSIYKFRSMVVNAEKIGSYSTEEADSRITFVGGWLRKTSIDELPQFINVLFGHMSLVGPRPDVPAQKNLYTEQEFRIRNSVRPGITGLAQCTLRSLATAEQRKALDLQYVKEISIYMDLKIIFMTIRQVFLRGGN
jgi:lipopolysaccharide/colanic/teichoic acid biosynthesis glycosyltransferase